MYMCIYICIPMVYVCICIYTYMYAYVYLYVVYVCMYMYIHTYVPVHIHMCAPCCICRNQRTLFRSDFSVPTIWVSGIKVRSLGMEARVFNSLSHLLSS